MSHGIEEGYTYIVASCVGDQTALDCRIGSRLSHLTAKALLYSREFTDYLDSQLDMLCLYSQPASGQYNFYDSYLCKKRMP